MARNYAQIVTAIWKNAEFRALEEGPQRIYLLLCTQSDISAAGVLALRIRRWADMAADSTPDRLIQSFKTLEERRFIIVDGDAEELLVRSFIRHDGGYRNRKRRPAIFRAMDEVGSKLIIAKIIVELERLGVSWAGDTRGEYRPNDQPKPEPRLSDALPDALPDSLSDGLSIGLDAAGSALDGPAEADAEINSSDTPPPTFPQVDSLSDRVSPSKGVGVKYSSKEPLTGNPEKNTPPSASRAAPTAVEAPPEPDPAEPTAQALVREWIDSRRKRPPGPVIGQTAKTVKAMLAEGITADDIRAGLCAWADKGLHPATLPSVVNEMMNSSPMQYAAGRPRKPNADDKIRALHAMGERLDAARADEVRGLPSAEKEQR